VKPIYAAGILAILFCISSGAGTIPAGWTCTGNCGSSGADGVVPLSPTGNSSYLWISTASGVAGAGVLPTGALGDETEGSDLVTPTFSANAGMALNFYFDYVTSDGPGYDYGWAELFDTTNTPVALLFSLQTESSGSIVPIPGQPAPLATLSPSSVPILGGFPPGGPTWSPLGGDSGACFTDGCGYTGWVNANYVIPTSGNYYLEVGVTNWADMQFNSGMAIDGVEVEGAQPGAAPEPATFAMLGAGLLALAGLARFRSAQQR